MGPATRIVVSFIAFLKWVTRTRQRNSTICLSLSKYPISCKVQLCWNSKLSTCSLSIRGYWSWSAHEEIIASACPSCFPFCHLWTFWERHPRFKDNCRPSTGHLKVLTDLCLFSWAKSCNSAFLFWRLRSPLPLVHLNDFHSFRYTYSFCFQPSIHLFVLCRTNNYCNCMCKGFPKWTYVER